MDGLTGAFSWRDVARRVGKPPDPHLVRAIVAVIPSGVTVVDLGAGTGRYVRVLRELGYAATGLDGGEGVEGASGGLVRPADLTVRSSLDGVRADWALCIEVGEHVPELLLPAFLGTICSVQAQSFLCSWALPGQRGRNHVSCRTPEWVAGEFSARGWWLDADATEAARQASLPSGFAKKMLVFRRFNP